MISYQPTTNALSVCSPYDGAQVGEVGVIDRREVDAKLQTAYRLFRHRDSWLPLHERIGVLERTARIMNRHHGELARLAASEGGKPLVDSQVEVTRAIDTVRTCIECVRTDAGTVIPMGIGLSSSHRLALTQHEPIGVAVAVSAFNHPLNLIAHQVAPAVAAGCPVIVKPSLSTPLSCLRFLEILREAGLPEGWCQSAIIEDNEVTQELITDSRVGYFSFIGSSAVGWMLRSKLAPGVRCGLEHGGAAPVLIAADADLELAVASITKGAYYHAGQVCVSTQRIFAASEIVEEFTSSLARSCAALKVGDPLQVDTQVGPLIRPAEVTRIETWVNEAVSQGAHCVTGGERLGQRAFACTVLAEPPPSAKVSRLEIFGPVVSVFGYDDVNAAIDAANSLPFAFQAAIFTRDIDRALHAFSRLDASAVMVNEHTAFRVDAMPFAGLRESGLGTGGVPYTLNELRNQKMLVINSPGIV